MTLSLQPPSAKRRKPNGPTLSSMAHNFKAGNIIRLRVWNFTTYNYGVFNLSPSLNMIIGPNGSGKSTFVAAVCLGLGGKLELIRRKSLDSMIKSGEKESRIEITLSAGQDKQPVVIERTLTLKLTKSKWEIDGVSSELALVSRLVKSLNIQLDNLCHFLPQERVAEFASLSPEKLLLEMERTIGDNTLIQKHELLIDLDKSLVEVTEKLDSAEEYINGLKDDVDKYAREAERFREYEVKSREIGLHKKLLPYAKLQDLRNLMANLKLVRDNAKNTLLEFNHNVKPLASLARDAVESTKALDEQLSELNHQVFLMTQKTATSTSHLSEIRTQIGECKNTINNLRFRTENEKLELSNTLEERDKILRDLNGIKVVDEEELSSLELQRLEKYDEKSSLAEELDTVKFQSNALGREIESRENRMREEHKKLTSNERLEVLRSTGTRYRREIMEMSYKAHSLLRKEKQKLGLRYYEAPVISCHVTDSRYAKYFEKIVDNMSLFALFFDNNEDYQAVSKILPTDANVPMRVVTKKNPEARIPKDLLARLGFDGCLSDFITGPESVIRCLKQRCFIHIIPVALKPISEELTREYLDFVTLLPGMKNARFAIENSLFLVGRSKHGSRQIFYNTENIAEAQLMAADGLTEELKKEISKRIQTLRENVVSLTEQRKQLLSSQEGLAARINVADSELKELDKLVRALKKQKETKLKLEDTLSHKESRILTLQRKTNEDYGDQISQAEGSLIQKYLESARLVADIAKQVEELSQHKIEVKNTELLRQQLENKALTYQSIRKELDKKEELLQRQYLEAKSKYDEHKKGSAANEIREQNLVGEEREAVREFAEKYNSQGTLTEQFVLQTIERLEDEISVLPNIDHGTLALLLSKKIDLENAETQLPIMQRKKSDIEARVQKICIPWAEELAQIVEQISRSFQKRFVAVASDGQVELVKADRFKDWKLEILVKFRDNSELKVLDHQSQSGGERAVSTIFFIMSLQGLTNAPIRIVDEINQGMDPKNEKQTHKYLVKTACTSDSSQYFLVTPKLLTGLYYHPDMAVHCIFTGPFLQSDSSSGGEYLDMHKKYSVEA